MTIIKIIVRCIGIFYVFLCTSFNIVFFDQPQQSLKTHSSCNFENIDRKSFDQIAQNAQIFVDYF